MEIDQVDLRLSNLERWWLATANPLYVWETIALSLAVNPPLPIPGWCLPCLQEASANITNLAWNYDRLVRVSPKKEAAIRGREEWDSVKKKLPLALGFARERQKNVFSRMSDDAYAARASVERDYGLQSGTKTSITVDGFGAVVNVVEAPIIPTEARLIEEKSIARDRAQRMISTGRKLTRPR